MTDSSQPRPPEEADRVEVYWQSLNGAEQQFLEAFTDTHSAKVLVCRRMWSPAGLADPSSVAGDYTFVLKERRRVVSTWQISPAGELKYSGQVVPAEQIESWLRHTDVPIPVGFPGNRGGFGYAASGSRAAVS